MEQLSGRAISQLLAAARKRDAAGGRQGDSGADSKADPGADSAPRRPMPWARRESYASGRPEPLAGSHAAAAPKLRATSPPPGGVERRLVRRAEAMWAGLATGGDLPPASSASRFLTAPLAGQALLLGLPADGGPEILFAGEALAAMTRLETGPAKAAAGPGATLGEQLVALGLRAAAAGSPTLLDSDFDAPPCLRGRPHLLFRAVALPFRPDSGIGGRGAVAIVCSWRKLLSAQETAALHRELAAAIDWMHGSMEKGLPA